MGPSRKHDFISPMLAALQAPIIMMSQNRQAAKDRFEARLKYETNLRSEAEIAGLHAKIDVLGADIERLVASQLDIGEGYGSLVEESA